MNSQLIFTPSFHADILRRVEALICNIHPLFKKTEDSGRQGEYALVLKGLGYLAKTIIARKPVFGYEPWHPLHFDLPLLAPAEMLLRLKNQNGQSFAPYPFIMACYNIDFTAEIDTILTLCALNQFAQSNLAQASINISARSLRNGLFVRDVLHHLKNMNLKKNQQVIFEIHESTPHMTMSRKTLKDFRRAGISFALDDVGLSMHDVMRLAEFEGLTDYVKLDRSSVCAHESNHKSLDHVMCFVTAMLPDALVVAEGVKTADHAFEIYKRHPDIHFVQGLRLPDEQTFSKQFKTRLLGSKRPLKHNDYPKEYSFS